MTAHTPVSTPRPRSARSRGRRTEDERTGYHLVMDVVPADLARLEEYATLFARTFADDAMIEGLPPVPVSATFVAMAFAGLPRSRHSCND